MTALFHTGFQIISAPDIKIGRKNADFGQGFYLSDNEAFSKRWARERKGFTTYLNKYALDTEGLRIKRFQRDGAWFDYIAANRSGRADALADFDVITGPIANDTIYDVWGVTTSGLLTKDQALKILSVGPEYRQTVVKTDRAVKALRFISAEEITGREIASCRSAVRAEEERFQRQIAELIGSVSDD